MSDILIVHSGREYQNRCYEEKHWAYIGIGRDKGKRCKVPSETDAINIVMITLVLAIYNIIHKLGQA